MDKLQQKSASVYTCVLPVIPMDIGISCLGEISNPGLQAGDGEQGHFYALVQAFKGLDKY